MPLTRAQGCVSSCPLPFASLPGWHRTTQAFIHTSRTSSPAPCPVTTSTSTSVDSPSYTHTQHRPGPVMSCGLTAGVYHGTSSVVGSRLSRARHSPFLIVKRCAKRRGRASAPTPVSSGDPSLGPRRTLRAAWEATRVWRPCTSDTRAGGQSWRPSASPAASAT